ncbi:MAG: ABC transporter permease [Beutenbergiaceae bacterium]
MKVSVFEKFMHRRATTMEKYLFSIIAVYAVVVSIRNPLFLSFETAFDMIRGGSGTMLLALGLVVVLISGGIDVSFTAVAIVSAYLTVLTMDAMGVDNLWFALAMSTAIGLSLGCLNALLIQALRLPTLIVTLGTASVYHGGMAVLVGTTDFTMNEMPRSLVAFGSSNLFTLTSESGQYGLTVFLPVVIGAVVLTWFILNRTMLGRSIYAIGSSQESASRLGIGILRTKLFVYGYIGALAGVMGVMYFAEIKYVNPTSLVGTELIILAAVVVGGAKLTGGEGTVLGTVLGVVVFVLFQTTLVFLGLDSSWNDFFFGGVLLASLALMYGRQRVADRKNLVFAEN